MRGAGRRSARAGRARPRWAAARRRASAMLARGKLLPRERVAARCSIPARRSWKSAQLAAHGMYGDEVPAAGIITGIGRVVGPRVHDRRQRRHGEGRHLLPDDGEEASARAGDRAAEPAALPLPGRFRRRQPAATRTRCFPTATISAASSSTRPTCRPHGIPQIAVRDGLLHRGRRLCAGDVGRERSSCAARARSSSAGRRW